MKAEKFLDGCHRWGWLIAPVLAVVGQGIVLAFMLGSLNQKVSDTGEDVREMKARILIIEAKVK